MKVLKYVLQVWLTSVFVAPLLMLAQFYDSSSMAEASNFYGIMVLWGSMLSFPSIICFGAAVNLLMDRVANPVLLKVFLSVIAVVLISAPFIMLDLFDEKLSAVLYVIVTIAGLWIYKLPLNSTSLVLPTIELP